MESSPDNGENLKRLCTQVHIKSTWSRHYHDLEAGAWEYVVIAVKGPNLTQTKYSNQAAKDATWVT